MSITIVPQSIKRLLRVNNCPSEQQLAAYADQQLIGNERSRIEQHLTFCDACLQQVGFLVHATSISSEPVPELLLRAAINLGKQSNPAPTYAWWRLATASALSVVLVVVLVGTWQKARQHETKGNPNVDATAMNSVAEVRTTTQALQGSVDKVRGEQESSDSILISPRPDETVDPSHLEFRWKLRDRATFYEIEVVSDAGDSVWKGQSNASSLRLPAHIHLERGKAYYVWIRIHMSRGSVEQSKAVRFTIG